MAHIVCITSGLRGLLNASFELLARLRQDGHKITYASPHDVSGPVRAQNISYVQLAPISFNPAPEPARKTGVLGGFRTRIGEWTSADRRRQLGVASLHMAEFRSFLQGQDPDLVLLDAELYEHIFTAREMGMQIALLTPFFTTRQHRKVPPLQSDIAPGEGWRGSTPGIWLHWWITRLMRWSRIRTISLRNAFTERRSVLRLYARRSGFPLGQLDQLDWVTLFTIRGLPTLSLTAVEIEFPHQPEPWWHYVGPMVAMARHEIDISPHDRARLADIFAAREAGACQLLYCGMTTMNESDHGILQRVIDAVAPHPEWLLVIGCNGAKSANLAKLPAHIHVFDTVPQIEVLKRSDLCITQGGVNTINECLCLTVPMLIYPTDFADKPGCASRIRHHHLGTRGDTLRDDAMAIARRIAQTLENDEIKRNLKSVGRQLQRYRDDRIVEKLINSLIDPTLNRRPGSGTVSLMSDRPQGNP